MSGHAIASLERMPCDAVQANDDCFVQQPALLAQAGSLPTSRIARLSLAHPILSRGLMAEYILNDWVE